jgi:hypothetical protein
MKTTILILALFCFSFSLESSTHSVGLTLEKASEAITITIHHHLGNGEFIEIDIPIEALEGHLIHGDHEDGGPCEPPICFPG